MEPIGRSTQIRRAKILLEAGIVGLLQDVRFAFRQLRKNRGHKMTATAMLTVAILSHSQKD
jgi:hypothetical protein